MKNMLYWGLCVLGLALAGCASHPPVDPRVTIADNIEGDILVSDVRLVKGVAADVPTAQVNVVNCTSKELWLDWKVEWLDATGATMDSLVSTWQSAAVAPRDTKSLKGVAPRPEAVNMRFYVRRTVR